MLMMMEIRSSFIEQLFTILELLMKTLLLQMMTKLNIPHLWRIMMKAQLKLKKLELMLDCSIFNCLYYVFQMINDIAIAIMLSNKPWIKQSTTRIVQ